MLQLAEGPIFRLLKPCPHWRL